MRSNEVAYVAGSPGRAARPCSRDLQQSGNRHQRAEAGDSGTSEALCEGADRRQRRKVGSSSGFWPVRRSLTGFEKLAKEKCPAPAQAKGATRAELNIHLTPARDAEKLYQMAEGDKVDILKRATTERATPGAPKSFSLSNQSKPSRKSQALNRRSGQGPRQPPHGKGCKCPAAGEHANVRANGAGRRQTRRSQADGRLVAGAQ